MRKLCFLVPFLLLASSGVAEDRLLLRIAEEPAPTAILYWRGTDLLAQAYQDTLLRKVGQEPFTANIVQSLLKNALIANRERTPERLRAVETLLNWSWHKGVLLGTDRHKSYVLLPVADDREAETLHQALRSYAEPVREVRIGSTVVATSFGDNSPTVTWFRSGDVIVVCDRPPEPEIVRAFGKPPAPLRAPHPFAPLIADFRTDQTAAALAAFALDAGPELSKALPVPGLDASRYLSVRLDFEGPETVTRIALHAPPRRGLLRAIDHPIRVDRLPPLPADTMAVTAWSFDATRLLDVCVEAIAARSGQSPEQIRASLRESLNQVTGTDLMDRFLNCAGNLLILTSSSKPIAGALVDLTVLLECRNDEQMRELLEEVIPRLVRVIHPQAELQRREYEGTELVSAVIPDFGEMRPSFAIADGWAVVGLTQSSVEQQLAVLLGKAPAWAYPPAVAAAVNETQQKRAFLFSAYNSEFVVRTLTLGLSPIQALTADSGGLPLPPEFTFPSQRLEQLFKDHWSRQLAYMTDDELVFELREPVPGLVLVSPSNVTPILAALLIPALVQPPAAALEDRACMDNLKFIMLAMHNYSAEHGHLPPPVLYGPDGKTRYSWRVALLPYLEQQRLFDRYRFDEPWDGPHNRRLLQEIPAVYRCPRATSDPTHTCYAVVVGEATAFAPGGKGHTFRDVKDGTSLTVGVVEIPGGIPWTEPRDLPFDEKLLEYLKPQHERGFYVGFLDGSVRLLPWRWLTIERLKALLTIAGGEVVELP